MVECSPPFGLELAFSPERSCSLDELFSVFGHGPLRHPDRIGFRTVTGTEASPSNPPVAPRSILCDRSKGIQE